MAAERRIFPIVAGGVVLVLSLALFIHIFGLAMEGGRTFAPYSTYRSDPVGTMALYGALDALPGHTAERFIGDFLELPHGGGKTLIIPGASLGADPTPILESLDGFAAQGGRVVIAFSPQIDKNLFRNFLEELEEGDDASKKETSPQDGDGGPQPDESEGEATDEKREAPEEGEKKETRRRPPNTTDISERWGFTYGYTPLSTGAGAVRDDGAPAIEPRIELRAGLYFVPGDDRWRVIYRREPSRSDVTTAVVMERPMGSGTIVLSSDSYFLSNEALRVHPAPDFLAWIAGDGTTSLFSEVHLGTQQRDRIMTLMRRYRLHGVLFAFALLGILFVWHHGTTLVPRREAEARLSATTNVERSHGDGLDNLLVRFIPRDQLLDTCVREWSHGQNQDARAQAVARLRAAQRAGGGADPASEYNEIVREIHRH